MLLRWLLPIVAAFALLGNAFTTFAAAGTFGETKCCCPDPKKCKCHDHDKPRPDEQMRRCSGDAVKVAPHVQVASMPATVETVLEMSEHVIEYDTIVISDQYVTHPEKPPF